MNEEVTTFQEGPQRDFLASKAHIAIFGGGAGGGKSYALLLEVLRHYDNPKFNGIIFRRNSTQIRNPGGLWDTSMELYAPLGGTPRQAFLEWEFPSGAKLKFAHLENPDTVFSYQGSQIPFVGFDELTHFEESQVWYMMSRLRSTSGVPGYMRMTCNPDPDSFVSKLISWWIDEAGFPIKERSGKLRWFIKRDDEIVWANESHQLTAQYGTEVMPKSLTFIPSLVRDNKILMEKDPAYLANLHALSRVDRMRLLEGNWLVKASAGMMFKREWFTVLDAVPAAWTQQCRYWDRAATRPNETNRDPDWTRGLKMYKYPNNTFMVVDLKSIQDTPGQVEKLVLNTASHDSISCPVVGEQDPGSAGVADAERFTQMLAGYDVRVRKVSQNKVVRAKPVSAQCEAGNIFVLRAPWNEEFFRELENFSEEMLGHDDIVDVFSGAFNELAGAGLSICDAF
jgi:predicted phage terminase large subunit-like protein